MGLITQTTRLRAQHLSVDVKEVLAYPGNADAPRELIRRLQLAEGSLTYWLENADSFQLANAIEEAERALKAWEDWRSAHDAGVR